MIDKDNLLPRLTFQEINQLVDPERAFRIQLGRLGEEHLTAVAQRQRDADLKRMEPLILALLAIRNSQDNDLGTYAEFCERKAREALAELGIEP